MPRVAGTGVSPVPSSGIVAALPLDCAVTDEDFGDALITYCASAIAGANPLLTPFVINGLAKAPEIPVVGTASDGGCCAA